MVQLQLARLAQAAGLPAHVHPHVLRHSHANISTTQVYTRLDFQHLARAYDQAHPRAGRKTSR
ncbi:integrase/recombinase [Bordetella pertussis]|nr:integrase/recombinase [Bordetella pertussis]